MQGVRNIRLRTSRVLPIVHFERSRTCGSRSQRHSVQLHYRKDPTSWLAWGSSLRPGQVELPQGPQVLAEIIGCEFDDLRIGMDVEMTLQAVPAENGGPDKAVYKWRPV